MSNRLEYNSKPKAQNNNWPWQQHMPGWACSYNKLVTEVILGRSCVANEMWEWYR